jgi:hypothetical protein
MRQHESARHRIEKLPTDDFHGRGKTRGKRFYEPGHHIVAMNGKAPARVSRTGANARRRRHFKIKKSIGES